VSDTPRPIAEWHDVDRSRFETEIAARYEPAVLRGVVGGWPAVAKARESAQAIAAYIDGFDSGALVDALMMPPAAKGRIFYNRDLNGFNYSHDKLPIASVNAQLMRYLKFENRPAVAVQSALVSQCLPGFAQENHLELLDGDVAPRIWLGNSVVTPAHFDESSNIACVVAGRRRFTLLPPEQVANLYIGPLDYAPTGTPISLVSFRDPDYERFPRFREALAAAFVAELEPGDALYIPPLWWHHVESLEKYNVLVNYWWKSAAQADSALGALVHALVSLRGLPEEQRRAWRTIFDHYVFDPTPPEHIPLSRRGVLGDMSPDFVAQVRAFLVRLLQR
jgi:hypothetical protein